MPPCGRDFSVRPKAEVRARYKFRCSDVRVACDTRSGERWGPIVGHRGRLIDLRYRTIRKAQVLGCHRNRLGRRKSWARSYPSWLPRPAPALRRLHALSQWKQRTLKMVVIADLDDLQHASWKWGQRRAAAGLDPAILVERVPHAQVFTRAAEIDLFVLDTPVCPDERIARLAKGSRLTVVCTRSRVDDVDLSIRLMHKLREKGVPDSAPRACALSRAEQC